MRYDYLQLGLLARQKITDNMWFGFRFDRTHRDDRYVGYNTYHRNQYTAEFDWSPGQRFDLDLRYYYRSYKYENAFAFTDPALGRKTLETGRGYVAASYRMTPRLSLQLDADLEVFASNDTRIQYDRNRYSLAIVWRQ